MATRNGTEDTRAAIRRVALELFVTKGFAATSLRHIADRLELTKAALYYHYPSKAELVHAILQPFMDDSDALFTELEGVADLEPRELFERWYDVVHRHGAIFTALMRDASGLAYVDLEEWAARLVIRAQTLLVGDDPSTEEAVRAVLAIGGLSRVTVYTDGDPARIRAAAVDAAVDALGPLPHPR